MAVETRSSLGILNPRRVFYGWWIVLSGFLLMLFSTGVGFYGFSAFVNPIADTVAGGSRTVVSGAVAIQRAESGVLGPIMGFLVDRIGPRKILVAGFMRDKDLRGIGEILCPMADTVIATEMRDNPRGVGADEIVRTWSDIGSSLRVNSSVGGAIAEAKSIASSSDMICITGSMILIGEAMRELEV